MYKAYCLDHENMGIPEVLECDQKPVDFPIFQVLDRGNEDNHSRNSFRGVRKMKLDKAIKTALEYETGVYEIYLEAMNKTTNETGKHVFKILCEEEKWHLDYLRDRLIEWQETGKIKAKTLQSAIPTKATIGGKLKPVRSTVMSKHTKQVFELELLKRALDAEIQTSNFYREMVAKLDGDGQQLFSRFLEIEDGHVAIVQAEIDNVDNWGFWFDTPEFRLESE